MKIINSTPNGQIFFCPRQNIYHLEFGNLFLHLSSSEINQFTDYVYSIDHKHYLEKNQSSQNKRKLLLQVGARHIYLALNLFEFLELRDLVSLRKNATLVDSKTIDYNILLN